MIWMPFMSGNFGNRVVLIPKRTTATRVSKTSPAPDKDVASVEDPTSMGKALYQLQPTAE